MNLLLKINSEKTNGTSYVRENRSNMFYMSITVVYSISHTCRRFIFLISASCVLTI